VGRTLVALAAGREVPIPVYAEMSSINPVFLLPGALVQRAEAIAQGLIDSVTLGTGQFCTKPGIVMGIAGPDFDRFVAAAEAAVAAKAATTMLNSGIHRAYCQGASDWGKDSGVRTLSAGGAPPAAGYAGQPQLFSTTAKRFLNAPNLMEEVFGPAAMLIECS